ncbi:MAG TPA: betaine-aldehyde dehydrogenase, partial [Acidimicrobiia bacterium]
MRAATVSGVRVPLDHWIGGERIPSSSVFEDISPIDESLIAEVARGGSFEAGAAVAAAKDAS